MAAAPRLLRSGLLLAQTVALLLLASRVARLPIANRRLREAVCILHRDALLAVRTASTLALLTRVHLDPGSEARLHAEVEVERGDLLRMAKHDAAHARGIWLDRDCERLDELRNRDEGRGR
jgi:hypothetical protein